MSVGIREICDRYDAYEYRKRCSREESEALLAEGNAVSGDIEQMNQLKMRQLSLQHRMGLRREGSSGDVFLLLMGDAQAWLRALPLQTYRKVEGKLTEVSELTVHQEERIRQAVDYRGFGELLLSDDTIKTDFFRWALLENCPVGPYVEYYGTCQGLIKPNILHKRVGYPKETPLRIQVKSKVGRGEYKRLTLPFEDQFGEAKLRSVHSVTKQLNMNGLIATKEAIYSQFRRKRETPGDVEMLGGVIRNWNYFYGRKTSENNTYRDFALEDENWYRRLPLFNRLTEQEMRAKYNVEGEVRPDQWVMCICANRESPTMDIARTHGFLVFLIPDGNGNYDELPFTFLARKFVSGYANGSTMDVLSQVWRLGTTEIGRWAFPDETMYYLRQFGVFPIVIEAMMGMKHMEALRESFLIAREGYQHFQISYMNCSGTIQEHAKRVHGDQVVPSIFNADILESTPKEPLGKVFRWLRKKPNWFVFLVIYLVGMVLLTLRGMVIKREGRYDYACMFRTPIFTQRRIYHAAKIFEYLFKHNVGAIWYGKSPRELTTYAQSS